MAFPSNYKCVASRSKAEFIKTISPIIVIMDVPKSLPQSQSFLRNDPIPPEFTLLHPEQDDDIIVRSPSGILIDITSRFRQGTGNPAKLRPLPLKRHFLPQNPQNHNVELTYESTVYPKILEILEKHKVQCSNMFLAYRSLPLRDPVDKDLSIFIQAKEESDSWIYLLNDISNFLKETKFPDVLVEIATEPACRGSFTYPLSTFPICKGDQLIRDWEAIRPKILHELRGTDWNALQCYRLGYESSGADTVRSVVISCRNYYADHWEETCLRIRRILKTLDYKVRLELWEDKIFRGYQSGPLILDYYYELCEMGSSLGYSYKSGTLGCYAILTDKKGEKSVFALTNYHVIQNNVTSEREKTGDPNAWSNNIRVDCPSLADVNETLASIECQRKIYDSRMDFYRPIAEAGDNESKGKFIVSERKMLELKKIREKLESFSSFFGIVHSFSGRRANDDGFPLDWALIEPKSNRVVGNYINVKKSCPEIEDIWPLNRYIFVSEISTEDPVPKTKKENNRVLKKGRSTRLTFGTINEIKPDVMFDGEEEEYSAWAICPLEGTGRFTEAGDSGAMVLDDNDKICGQIIGASVIYKHSYMVPIKAIFDDISKITDSAVDLYCV